MEPSEEPYRFPAELSTAAASPGTLEATPLCISLPPDIADALQNIAWQRNMDLAAAVVAVLRSHVVLRSRAILTPRQLMGIRAEAKARNYEWQQSELEERGLPLYWSESWLRAQLARGLTLPALSALYGYSSRTLAMHAHQYGIVQREDAGMDTYVKARLLYEEGWSRADIAAELGFSEVTVGKALSDQPGEKQRYIEQKVQQAGPYPASVQEVAQRLFGGNAELARPWLYRMVKTGRLQRAARNRYSLPTSAVQIEGI